MPVTCAEIAPGVHREALRLAPSTQLTITPMEPGASDRRFYRVSFPGGSAIACRFTTDTRREYATYGRLGVILFEAGLPVPKILADDPRRGWVWLEDCGDLRLDGELARLTGERINRVYGEIRESILRLQTLPSETVCRLPMAGVFDRACYTSEHRYFIRELAAPLLQVDSEQLEAMLAIDFESLQRSLDCDGGSLVPVHRDLQSSNILLTPGGIRWIDFQSMRFGHPAFDTASILLDPHAPHDPGWIEYQIEADAVLRGRPARIWRAEVQTAGTQRLLQALGAHGLHGLRYRKASYRARIPVALNLLHDHLPEFLQGGPLHQMVLKLLVTRT